MHRIESSRFATPRALFAVLCLGFLWVPIAKADTPDYWDGDWHGSIQPYGWLPGISAKTRYQLPDNGPTVEQKSNNDIFSSLSGALMIDGTVRKGDWGFYGDLDWVKFSNEDGRFTNIGGQRFGANANLDTRWNMKGGMVTLAGLYTLAHGQQGYIDLVFGARYLWLKGNLNWNFSLTGNRGNLNISDSGHLSNQTHVTDGIVGIRGRWSPFAGSNWFFPYYADIGTGGSDNTYQLMVGVAYGFHWGDIALNYRDVEYKKNGGDEFLKSVELSGPALSLTWHF
ncbi:hypothetical protein [Dyella terrae]|uniref:hypothetical protein n=1 Tax=Dyella terrae TaxID=522259 RepID=UPI001EFEDA4C|nr:hypothetical protein [Dyella terrae]ULU23338.1 hypothetical protein DYST_00233 [Dyella terrae]